MVTTTVLLTGFEPFGGDVANPSGEAVHRVASRWEGPELLVTAVLPVTFTGAAARLRGLLAEYRPDVVITHDPFRPYAFHPDHRAVGYATTDAVYPTARDPLYFNEHLQEGFEPHKTAEIWYFGAEYPDLFVDVTDYFDRKIVALQAHVCQVGDRPKDEFAKGLRDRLADLAKDQDFELAEAFKVVQMRR